MCVCVRMNIRLPETREINHLLKKEREEFSVSLSSSQLVRLPLWMRYMPRGEFTKNGCAS